MLGAALGKGARVMDERKSEGEVVSVMPDGRIAVLFDDGDVQRYDRDQWSSLRVTAAPAPQCNPEELQMWEGSP